MDAETERFWEGLRDEHRLLLRHCLACDSYLSFPRAICPACGSLKLDWVESAGTGEIYSFTVSHRQVPGFDLEPPYVVALVDLDEGPRMLTNIIGSDPDAVRIGARLTLVVDQISDDVALPRFSLAE